MKNKTISVIVPCYNEEGSIEELYSRLQKVITSSGYNHEIIFVDNQSTDRSRDILRDLSKKDSSLMAIFFSRNFGHSQYGFTAGSEYAKGDAIVWIDADLQDPPEVIETFIKKWEEGHDVVYGIRKKRRGSLFLQVSYKLFYRLFKKFSYLDIPFDA